LNSITQIKESRDRKNQAKPVVWNGGKVERKRVLPSSGDGKRDIEKRKGSVLGPLGNHLRSWRKRSEIYPPKSGADLRALIWVKRRPCQPSCDREKKE